MSNQNNPHGFLPVGSLNGSADIVRMYVKAAGDTVLGIGDLVNISGALNTVTRSAAGGPFLGPSLAYASAASAGTIPVMIANKMKLLESQENGNGGVTMEGGNCNMVVTGSASAYTGRSGMEINTSTANTTNTLDVHIFQLAPYVDNDGTASYARWFVQINDSTMADLKAGV